MPEYCRSGAERIDCHVVFTNSGSRRDVSAIVRRYAGAMQRKRGHFMEGGAGSLGLVFLSVIGRNFALSMPASN